MRILQNLIDSKEINDGWAVYKLSKSYDKDGSEIWTYLGNVFGTCVNHANDKVLSVEKHKCRVLLDV